MPQPGETSRRKGFIWLAALGHSPSLRKVRWQEMKQGLWKNSTFSLVQPSFPPPPFFFFTYFRTRDGTAHSSLGPSSLVSNQDSLSQAGPQAVWSIQFFSGGLLFTGDSRFFQVNSKNGLVQSTSGSNSLWAECRHREAREPGKVLYGPSV